MRSLASFAALAGASLVAGPAAAFTYETPYTDGCHETITTSAMRAVRAEGLAPRIAYTRDERALAEDVPFSVASDLDDLAGVTLLIGARENDLRGRTPLDLDNLATLHGDDARQREHCLRSAAYDNHEGTVAAVADCRAYIRRKFIEAIDAAPSDRSDVKLALRVRGLVTAPLPTTYVRLGEALHALQDSFTHAFRTTDGHEITVVLNWIEHVERELDESRDGPPHMSALDKCDNSNAIHTNRREWATAASTELLRAALDTRSSRDAKLAALDATLDRWLGIKSGCVEANDWCSAPELAMRDSGCSCSQAPASGSTLGLAMCGALFALVFLRRARFAALLPLLLPATASAEEKEPAFKPCPTPEVPPESEKLPPGHVLNNFGVHLGAAASYDGPAFSGNLGLRYRITDTWLVGVDGEWNPWGSPLEKVRPGAFNAYGTLIRRWTLRSDTYALRSSLHAGTSTILFDLYGVPKGTTGAYVGVSLLALEARLGSGLTLIFEPSDIAIPMPQLRGYFGYPQYRFTLALQWGAAGR